MLVSDGDKKATFYYVGHLRRERLWGLRAIKSTSESSTFLKDMGEIGADIVARQPALDAEAAAHVEQIDAILSRKEFAETNAAFDEYRKKHPREHEPPWYRVLGIRSVRELATKLQRLPEYVMHYGRGSLVTHSSSYSDHFQFGKDGVSGYPVRHLADISNVLNHVFANAMLVFRHVLGFYRNDELPAFGRLYVTEWRQPFLNIPDVKIEFVNRPGSTS
jgi:hypothetical protein